MIYFIPSWYQQNKWCENEQNWHARRMQTEFDDTVKHIQLFHRSKAYPYQIILLGFTPNLRHFLHRQSVYHAPYWSCFDAIQEISRKKAALLSFHNLNWPEHIEFLYTPFVVVALLNGEKYAQIEFGEDGNPIEIDLYQKGQLQRRNIYDDRGFVSSTIVYEQATPIYQDYLTEKGVWKLRYFYEDSHVEINPKSSHYLLSFGETEQNHSFLHLSYERIEQVILEVLTAYLQLTDDKDLFCVAMHQLHSELLAEALKDKKMILSFYKDRYNLKEHKRAIKMIESADFLITDSKENIEKLQQETGRAYMHIKDITPFDSRVDFGISQQLNVQKILVPVDGLDEVFFKEQIHQLGEYLLKNENAQVHLFTRQAEYNRKSQLLKQTRQFLKDTGLPLEWAKEETKNVILENDVDDIEMKPIRFFVEQCVDELSVSKCMREQRIIVDMRDLADLYLRITAISIGIPQILYRENQFVEHEKNGLIIKDMERLSEAVDYYLDNLTNWNEAMVYSYEVGKGYTTEVLVEEWKEVIDIVRNNSSITAGK